MVCALLQVLEGEGITTHVTVPSKRELQGLDRLHLDFGLGCGGHMDSGALIDNRFRSCCAIYLICTLSEMVIKLGVFRTVTAREADVWTQLPTIHSAVFRF